MARRCKDEAISICPGTSAIRHDQGEELMDTCWFRGCTLGTAVLSMRADGAEEGADDDNGSRGILMILRHDIGA